MADHTRANPIIGTVSETGATLLVAGGVVSAFGAASCCALPLLLGSLGLASAWLGSFALIGRRCSLWLLYAWSLVGACGSGVAVWVRHVRRGRFAVCPCPPYWLRVLSALGPP